MTEPDPQDSAQAAPPAAPPAVLPTVSQADLEMLAEPVRQALAAILPMFIARVRAIGWGNGALIGGLVISGAFPRRLLVVLPIAGLVFVAGTLASWWRFTFRVEHDKLLVTKGVFSRVNQEIPFDKVQSVALEEGLLQRLFGLVSASVDTAGSSLTEFEILGVRRPQAEALKRLASQTTSPSIVEDAASLHQPPPPESAAVSAHLAPHEAHAADPEVVLAQRTPKDLFVLGLLSNPLLGFAVLAGSLPFFDDLSAKPVVSRAKDQAGEVELTRVLVVAVLASIGALALIVWLLVGIKNVVVNWDERLYRTSDGLGLQAGLLNRTSQSSLIAKVQSIEIRSGPGRRRLGFSAMNLGVIGSGDFNMRGLRSKELGAVRSMIGLDATSDPQRRVSRHLIFFHVRLAVLAAVPAMAVLAWLDWRFAPLSLLIPFAAGSESWRRYRHFRWSLEPDRVVASQGWIYRRRDEMARSKMQRVTVSQTLYQRRRNLASITVSNAENDIEIPMIFLSEANEIRDELLVRC